MDRNFNAADGYRLIYDVMEGNIRHVAVEPSAKVCSTRIDFDIEDGRLHNVRYTGGCHGNLQAIGRLLEGMDAAKASALLSGVDCRQRGTSCTDQLSRAISGLD